MRLSIRPKFFVKFQDSLACIGVFVQESIHPSSTTRNIQKSHTSNCEFITSNDGKRS